MQEYQKAEFEVIYFGGSNVVVTSGGEGSDEGEDTAEDMDW